MNWPISAYRLASVSLVSATLLFTAAGCEDASNLGVELPGTTAANTDYRDFDVTASTVLRDSLDTQKSSQILLGRVRDNVLGTTTASAYLNLKIAQALPARDTVPSGVRQVTGVDANPQLDSLVIEAPFETVYGSATAPLRVNIYQLAQPLDERQVYNSSSSVVTGAELGLNVSARLNGVKKEWQRTNPTSATDKDSVLVTTPDKVVRLKLHGGGRTLPLANDVFALLKGTNFTQASLNALWKGIAIQPTSDFNTAVASILPGGGTRVVFHYHYTNKKNTGTLKGRYSLALGLTGFQSFGNAPRFFTQITNELPTGSPLSRLAGTAGAAQSVPAAETDGKVYMQGGNGFGAKLEIPGLNELRTLAQPTTDGGSPAIAINRAELLIPVSPFANLLFPQATSAYLYEVNASNQALQRTVLNTRIERMVLRDGVNPTGAGLTSIGDDQYSGGYYQNTAKATLNNPLNTFYSTSITSYVQAYVYDRLNGPSPAAFVFSPFLRNSFTLDLNRAVLDGTNIKLRVYYSKLR
ncbi:DUF4270 family protein [Hymenobacter psychrotolerans]|uniref:DUF4270 domain-containing protein n=1 Tax=Hymenobacter psychrotolerans DSM 18569 TaxID=1121959 RepID=A0A1M6Q4H1_9BACT|nr:DUF4270 family protein [Hymenobacter psychrotolerans]SHK15026.1 protein of unknown function [Hymenobacter psychrotolerans DSM 18569]